LNIILIISDTLRRDYCGCYGNDWVRTPYIDALAKESTKFTHFYTASFPTRPMRKDVHCGRFTFTYERWGGELQSGEALLAKELKRRGYSTALIGDTPSNPGFEPGFDHFEIIPGQGGPPLDPELAMKKRFKLPAAVRKLRTPRERLQKIMADAAVWQGEEDRYVAQTMRASRRWLESQYGSTKPFFLLVDTFDPHEPWNPPSYYIETYDPNYKGDELVEPRYWTAEYATRREIDHMRKMYAGEVTLVDRWAGYLLEGIRQMGLWDDTAIILTSDHGFYHGEHNLIGKLQLDRKGIICRRWPLYETIAQAPLLIRVPGMEGGKTRSGLCESPDLMPTILDLARARIPKTVQGASLMPIVRGKTTSIRDCAVSSGTYLQDEEVRCPTSFRTKKYLYIYGGDEWQSELYDLQADPEEKRNIFRKARPTAQKLHERYVEFLEAIDCPSVSLDLRREFDPTPREKLPYMKYL